MNPGCGTPHPLPLRQVGWEKLSTWTNKRSVTVWVKNGIWVAGSCIGGEEYAVEVNGERLSADSLQDAEEAAKAFSL